jgi:aryl-alcohol dehydrogenase-like predicted oxidoreductase
VSITGAFAAPQKVRTGDIPTVKLGKTGMQVSVIAQGGARMDLHPDIKTAAGHVRRMYDIGVSYFDCARLFWGGRSEEAYRHRPGGRSQESLPHD